MPACYHIYFGVANQNPEDRLGVHNASLLPLLP
ncbi:hypothetical protein GALL_410400 [mine drainage metagenome]|uniref:Uncharacterized protein n=1 Tax=mine drainage metagenome TaxID=410659 RepID=A0A1J5QID9_9ZZZZ